MPLSRQLLSTAECRAKIAIVRTYQAQNSSPEGLTVPVIARLAAFPRHQSGWTFGAELAASHTKHGLCTAEAISLA